MTAIIGKSGEYHAPASLTEVETDPKKVVKVAGEKLTETSYPKEPILSIGHACGGRILTGTKKYPLMATDVSV